LEAQDNPRNDAGTAAFSFARHILSETSDCDFNPTGALHLAYDEERTTRLRNFIERNGWLEPHMQWIKTAETKDICGLTLSYNGLFYADAATVNTKKFVERLLIGCLLASAPMTDRVVIHATGLALPVSAKLQPVRGQVTYIEAPQKLKCPVMFGHYIAPTPDGLWSLGASFEQNNAVPDIKPEDTIKNIEA